MYLHILAGRHARSLGFRHLELDFQRIQTHQFDQGLSGVDILTDADLTQADYALERRTDLCFSQARFGGGQFGIVDFRGRQRGVRIGFGNHLLGGQLDDARTVAFTGAYGRKRFIDFGLGDIGVEREQQSAGGYTLAFGDLHPHQFTGHFRADHHRFDGAQATDRIQAVRQVAGFGLDGVDQGRRHAAAGRALLRGFIAAGGQTEQYGGEQNEAHALLQQCLG